jgi:hypothetical protein
MRLLVWLLDRLLPVLREPQGEPLSPSIPLEAHAMLKHHNARCGGESGFLEVTAPPLRGSLRDRMQRERR